MPELRRRDVDPRHEPTLQRLLAGVAATPTSTLDPSMVRLLLAELPRSPEHVIVIEDAQGELALVACLLDTVRSWANVAIFEVLAWSGAPAAFEAGLTIAEDLTRGGPRARMELPLYPALEGLRPLLEARGFELAFNSYDMERREVGPDLETPTLPPGHRWVDVDERRVAVYHEVVSLAFQGIPGANVASVEQLRRLLTALPIPARLLLDAAGAPAGIARTSLKARRGTVDTIARHPDHRGKGIGPLLLCASLADLSRRGASSAWLSVAADNERALELYRRFDFEVIRVEPSLHSPELCP